MTQLKDSKFVTTLVSVFKKTDSEDKTKYDNVYSSSKAEIISIKVILMMCFNQFILQLYQTYENI